MKVFAYLTGQGESKIDRPLPTEGAGRYLRLLAMHFWKLATLNLLFIAFSLPLVTLPAALCGANRVCIKLIREGNVFIWDEFITEFKGSFLKSLSSGLLFGLLLVVAYYSFSLGLSNSETLWSLGFTALGFLALLITASWGSYSFVLTAMLPLGGRDLLKNALALVMLRPLRALAVSAVVLGLGFFGIALFPFFLLPLIFCGFALGQYTACFLVNTAAQELIIGPFEAQKEV